MDCQLQFTVILIYNAITQNICFVKGSLKYDVYLRDKNKAHLNLVPVTVTSLRHLDTSIVGDVIARRSKMHGEFVSLKQRPVTSRAVFYRIKSAVARIFTAW